jgi:plasmid stability protein
MAAIHVRDLPDEVVEALKQRAARHHRSLQKELRHILESIAREEPDLETLPPIRLKLSRAKPRGRWGRDEIYGDDGR